MLGAEEPVKVTAPMVEQALASWGGEPSQLELMEVISAFETPRVKFDVIRQHFYPCKEAPTLHGSAQVHPAADVLAAWPHLASPLHRAACGCTKLQPT